jgi:hypothetical protein
MQTVTPALMRHYLIVEFCAAVRCGKPDLSIEGLGAGARAAERL